MKPDLESLNQACRGTMAESLGMKVVACGPEGIVVTMPVDPRTHQPLGYLHGGASVALAETTASIGGWYHCSQAGQYVLGLEINANHLRSLKSGTVTATGQLLHQGRTTQVWDVKIRDEAARLVCVSRCTLAVVSAQP